LALVAPGLIEELQEIVGAGGVLHRPEDLLVFEYDAYLEIGTPSVVVQPETTAAVQAVVALAGRHRLPVVPRGGATGLSGGAVAVQGGILVDLNRMYQVLTLALDDRAARVQPGLINSELSAAVAPDGYFYAPDPSSQRASTIGGNIAENAGGPHCLAHGMTTNHVLGLTLVSGDGEAYQVGGRAPDSPGYDLTGLVVSSEGTLGVVTEAWLRLLPNPPLTVTLLALFETLEAAGAAVSAIVARGIVPAALELIDGGTAQAIEAAYGAGYPPGVEGLLLIDLDGLAEAVTVEAEAVVAICQAAAAREVRRAELTSEREALWAGRKGALAALARIAPNYYLHDMVVPRSRLAETLRAVLAVATEHGFFVSNVAHAGDGNLHPTIMFDLREPGIMSRVIAAGEAILRIGVAAGGTISGEHGIGLEKQEYMSWIYSPDDLALMQRVRAAFSPDGRFNPGKIFPSGQARQVRLKVGSSAAVAPGTWI
jgi:glycolate dehydrogenase FAD-linked subunit